MKSLRFSILVSAGQLLVLLGMMVLCKEASLVVKLFLSVLLCLVSPCVLFLRFYDLNKVVYRKDDEDEFGSEANSNTSMDNL